MQEKEKKLIIIRRSAGEEKSAGERVKKKEQVQKVKLPEDFLRELDGKKCRVWVYAGDVREYEGFLRVARYDVKIERSSGYKVFDESAVEAIFSSSKYFPAPPAEVKINIPIVFKLE